MTPEQVATALAVRCELCRAPAGEPCRNTIRPGQPLPGRRIHYYRIPTATANENGHAPR